VVFRIQARLSFATTAARTAARTVISNALSGRGATVVRDSDVTFQGQPAIVWEVVEADTGDAGTIYALIQAMATPLAGSRVSHHTCWHDDNQNPCLGTAEKVW
jgi:hypothetical protein